MPFTTLKLAKRRGLNLKDLSDITDLLQQGKPLPANCRDHALTGNLGRCAYRIGSFKEKKTKAVDTSRMGY